MELPKVTGTAYDILDSLASEPRAWSVTELCEDTGRSRSSVGGVCHTLENYGCVTQSNRTECPRNTLQVQITDHGLRWLWLVDHKIPPRHEAFLVGVLEILEQTGPIETGALKHRGTQTWKAVRVLLNGRYIAAASRPYNRREVRLTERGRQLLGSIRGLNADRLRRRDAAVLG